MPETAGSHETVTPHKRRGTARALWIALAVLLVLPLIAYGGFVLYVNQQFETAKGDLFDPPDMKSPAKTSTAKKTPAAKNTDTAAVDEDVQRRKKIVGTWTRFDEGRRQLTFNADGTGELIIEPDGYVKRLLLRTKKVTIQIQWTLNDGRVKFQSISGEPEFGFKAIVKFRGSEMVRRIVELDAEKFSWSDDEEEAVFHWERQ